MRQLMLKTTTGALTSDEMFAALMQRDSAYDGVFFVGVKTTGIFCRPTCAARKPLRKNVVFFSSSADALAGGFRPCKKCRPMQVAGRLPEWLQPLLEKVDAAPTERWSDQDIRNFGLDPARVSRWFKANHGITFHGYLRCRRLSSALAQLCVGDDVTRVALDAGYTSLSGFRDAFQKWFGATPSQATAGNAVLVNRILTPLGPLVVAANSQALLLLEFADRRMLQTQVRRLATRLRCHFCPGENAIIEQTNAQVEEYFQGSRRAFDIEMSLVGTDFQVATWKALLEIPFGETSTYETLAKQLGRPTACRAVGRANGDNRLGIVVPCHRVIRTDGSLSGYGGGIRRKEWLLSHERSVAGST